MAEERLQKILARAGIASRRKAEELITSGRVRVEGRIVTELGSKADTRAKIEVDGRRIEREQLCYGVFHKPRQMVTTLSDPEGRPTAQDVLRQVGVRVVPVGRLDFNTSGALLFTNDGDFAQGLSHAKSNVPKVYVATVQGVPDERKMALWGESIDVEGKRTRPAEVRILRREEGKSWLEVTIKEGKNRQVRRLAEHADTPVVRLSRLSHAGITTEGLRPGEWRLLTVDELKELKKTYGVPEKIRGIMEVVPPRSTTRRAAPAPRGREPRSLADGEASGERPQRGRGDAAPRGRDAAPRGRDAAPRGRDAAPRGRDAAPRGRDAAPRGRDAAPSRGRDANAARREFAPGRPTASVERPPRGSATAGRPPRASATAGRPPRASASASRPPRGSATAGPPPRGSATASRPPRGSASAPRPKKRS